MSRIQKRQRIPAAAYHASTEYRKRLQSFSTDESPTTKRKMDGECGHWMHGFISIPLPLLLLSISPVSRDLSHVGSTKQLHDGLLISQESDLNIQNDIWTLFITIQAPPYFDIYQSVKLLHVTVQTGGQFSNQTSINWNNRLDWIAPNIFLVSLWMRSWLNAVH